MFKGIKLTLNWERRHTLRAMTREKETLWRSRNSTQGQQQVHGTQESFKCLLQLPREMIHVQPTNSRPYNRGMVMTGDAGSTFTDTVVDEVKKDGSEADLSDGSVQKKPPGCLLQSIGCTISEAVSSAKDVTVGYWNKEGPPQSTGSITGRDATRAEDVMELDAHHRDKLQEHLNSPAEAKKALASAGAAVVSSAAAAKDAVVRAFSSSTSK